MQYPTAHTSLGPTATVPKNSSFLYSPGLGLGTIRHRCPSQCSARVIHLPCRFWYPTAQAARADRPATAVRALSWDPIPGPGTIVHRAGKAAGFTRGAGPAG